MDAQGMNKTFDAGCAWLLGAIVVGGCCIFVAGTIIGFCVAVAYLLG